jgi:YQGE family putative transporter
MKILLLTNMIFAFVLPVIEVFVAAYIMRNSHDASKVASYQLAIYTGNPFAFLLNGLLLEKLGVKRLYMLGMILSAASILLMMSSNLITLPDIALSGLLMGIATGLFWANRGLLALLTTDDDNRNYFYGVEMFCYTITSVVVPAAIGGFIAFSGEFGWV